MRITELTAENVKRLTAVHIKPDGSMVVIGGENGAGKSSVLDSIMYALAGGRTIPPVPIHTGKKRASITVQLDGDPEKDLPAMTVQRTFTAKGGTITIRTDKGHTLPTPQALLDSLCGRIAFDPLAFVRLSPTAQADQLRAVVGLDFTDADAKRAALYAERTEVNRELKRLESHLESIPDPGDKLSEPTSLADLMAELERQEASNRRADGLSQESAEAGRLVDRCADDVAGLELELAKAKERLEAACARSKAANDAHLAAQHVDTAEIRRRIAESESIAEQHRQAKARQTTLAQIETATADSRKLSAQIAGIDAGKQTAMEAAKWPVEGLGFDDDGLMMNGLPFVQASQAEQLRIAAAIGLAVNPTLRVLLIRDASLLDAKSMAMVAQIAESNDAQIWVERVGDVDDCAVVIEDGHVRGDDDPALFADGDSLPAEEPDNG